MSEDIYIKRLGKEDWQDLKSIRLEALRANPDVFLRRYDEEKQQADDYWQRSFKEDAFKEKAIFGVYDQNQIIGMGGLFPEADVQRAARLGGAYISAPYRGKGIAHKLLQMRLDWAKASGLYDAAYISHRKGNAASRSVILNAGFELVEEKAIQWPDGAVDDEYIYKLEL